MGAPLFGMSTHLFHGERLSRAHVDALAASGWPAIEVFATRTHFDYRDPQAATDLAGWLRDANASAISMHAPICESLTNGAWGRSYSNASADPARRRKAVDEAGAAVRAAADLGCRILVVHLGLPMSQLAAPDDNDAGAARRSVEELAELTSRRGLRLALEVMPNALSTPAGLVDVLNVLGGDLEIGDAGICLDVGHAHVLGDIGDAVEIVSGHLLTTHLHDNRKKTDDHLVPFQGSINWSETLMVLQKVGYDGPLVFEVADHGDAGGVLARATDARGRLAALLHEDWLTTFEEQ